MKSRILIVGGPKSGKTSTANALAQLIYERAKGVPPPRVRHTDDLIGSGMKWSEESLLVSTWFDDPGPWIIEGIVTVRALKKWLARSPSHEKPADYIFYAEVARLPLEPKQQALMKQCNDVWIEIRPALLDRNVAVRSISTAIAVARIGIE